MAAKSALCLPQAWAPISFWFSLGINRIERPADAPRDDSSVLVLNRDYLMFAHLRCRPSSDCPCPFTPRSLRHGRPKHRRVLHPICLSPPAVRVWRFPTFGSAVHVGAENGQCHPRVAQRRIMSLECPGVLKIAEASGAHTDRIEHGGDLPGALERAIKLSAKSDAWSLDGSVRISDSD